MEHAQFPRSVDIVAPCRKGERVPLPCHRVRVENARGLERRHDHLRVAVEALVQGMVRTFMVDIGCVGGDGRRGQELLELCHDIDVSVHECVPLVQCGGEIETVMKKVFQNRLHEFHMQKIAGR